MSDNHKFRYGGASLNLVHHQSDTWSLVNLWSENRGRGEAKAVMEQACLFADQHDLILRLVIMMYGNYDSAMLDNRGLEIFYSKFDFEVIDRRPTTMLRLPKSQELHVS